MSYYNNEQLVKDIETYDTDNIIISKATENSIPNQPNLKYKRLMISTKYDDGNIGDLLLSTEEVFSFGVSENTAVGNPNEVNGYVFPLCLYNKSGASDRERKWVESFNRISDYIQEYIKQNKKELDVTDIITKDHMLDEINPLFYKKDNPSQGPVLYAKLLVSRNKPKDDGNVSEKFNIRTMFTNMDDPEDNVQYVNPMSLIKKYCFAVGVVKLECVFVNKKTVKLQVKLREASVRLLDREPKRLLRPTRHVSVPTISYEEEEEKQATSNQFDKLTIEDTRSTGSIKADSDNEGDTYTIEPPKTVAKKTTATKKKK